jgi:hypothetical protein
MGGNMLHIVEAVRQNYLQGGRILCSIQGNVSMSRPTLNRKRATTVKKGISSLVSSRAVSRRMTGVQVTENEETFSGQCELKNIISEFWDIVGGAPCSRAVGRNKLNSTGGRDHWDPDAFKNPHSERRQ